MHAGCRRLRGTLASSHVPYGRPRSRNCSHFFAESLQDFQKQQSSASAHQILKDPLRQNLSFQSVASLLKRCGEAKDLQQGRLLHSFVSKCKFSRNTLLGNCIVHMYGSCGSLQEATEAFSNIPKLNTHSWNIYVNACVKCGRPQEAMDAFAQMLVKGFKLTASTFACALDACSCLTSLDVGRMVYAAVVEYECEGDLIVGTAIIKMYGKCGVLHDAQSVFDAMPQRDVVAWSSMIATCTHNEHGHEAWKLYNQMQHACIIPDQVACLCALDACAILGSSNQGQQVHIAVLENGCKGDVAVGTSLINMYGKCSSLDKAMGAFYRISQKNLVTWNTMITVCVLNGRSKEALVFFIRMQLEGFFPDQATYVSVLNACSSLAAVKNGQKIHCIIRYTDCDEDAVLATSIIKMYGKCGRLDDAKNSFSKMTNKDVIAWCAIITACIQRGQNKDALKFFHRMHLAGIDPDEAVYVCTLDVCGKVVDLDKGRELHTAIVEYGLEDDTTVGTALIDMYGKCGSLHNAKTVFKDMPDRNMVTWSAMIAAYAHNGYAKEAIILFQEMPCHNMVANDITFRSILTACSYTGQLSDGVYYFMTLCQEKGLLETAEHRLSLIDLLGRA
eukprot:c24123_g9_i1 orf=95-1942(+)